MNPRRRSRASGSLGAHSTDVARAWVPARAGTTNFREIR
jgi:hypothetical protein